jgi:hypothetical protein
MSKKTQKTAEPKKKGKKGAAEQPAAETPPVETPAAAEPSAAKAPADAATAEVTEAKPKRGKKGTKPPKAAKPKKMSAIDAAAKVLSEAGEPMNCQDMIKAMAEKGYWKSPGGQTPAATLYSAILREIGNKGKEARFKKTERGKFAAK